MTLRQKLENEFALWNVQSLGDVIPSCNYNIMIDNLMKIYKECLGKDIKQFNFGDICIYEEV